MRAMILAAGLGTRLRPLTNDRPKALVEINGHTLLEITLTRLRSSGISDVIINVHHLADSIVEYLKINNSFGMKLEISREDILLDTGGGLKKAAHFFLEDELDEPFLLHNVDVISSIDIGRMIQFHLENYALATLAVQERETSRYLLFDRQLQLCGRRSSDQGDELVRSTQPLQALAFCGIHVLSRQIFPLLTEEGVFPIIPAYLRLAGQGERILGFRADEYSWRDLGTPESVRQAAEHSAEGILPR
ncbi:MAG: nucleotidyltransferase family protein [Candidatus Korobacteraceae bacterium]|jgi:NDP-sugar pyrophosphorylase family protein